MRAFKEVSFYYFVDIKAEFIKLRAVFLYTSHNAAEAMRAAAQPSAHSGAVTAKSLPNNKAIKTVCTTHTHTYTDTCAFSKYLLSTS